MNLSTIICFSLFLIGVVAGLLQLWFQVWHDETFIKMILTDSAFFVVSFVWAFLIKEQRESEKISGKNSLD